MLIVITQNSATARWAAERLHLGVRGCPSLTVRPFVLGPDNVPVIADEREAAAILESLAAALRTIDPDSAAVFVQFVDSCLADPQAQQMWRDLMTDVQYFWRHPLAEQVREEGREEGRVQATAEMLLRIFGWRRIDVPESVRDRILASTNLDELNAWLDRANHVTEASELFVGE